MAEDAQKRLPAPADLRVGGAPGLRHLSLPFAPAQIR